MQVKEVIRITKKITITVSGLKFESDVAYISDLLKEGGFTIDTLSAWEGDD